MSLATAPSPPRPVSPDRSTLPPRHGSPLNPLSRPLKTTKIAASAAATTSTRTHLANLDRLLLKQVPTSQPNPTHQPSFTHDSDSTSPRGGRVGSGLFNALNLPSLFPHPTEQMSPRSLAHLHRLLSESPRVSPKNSIGSRWRLYHGAADWAGLLDPLDENLRRELVRYGDLIGAAYHAFQSRPSARPDRPRHVVLPDRSYHVTASLYASSSLDLPRWVASAVPPWMTQPSSWMGYVAVCDSEREIQRMGRRDIVIALRGTATCLEWAENFRAGLVPIEDKEEGTESVAKVACGFWSLFKTPGKRVPSLAESVVAEVRRLMDKYKGEELSISITGHSLGAALGLLVADELAGALGPSAPPVAVFSFGGPKVGNQAFMDRVEARGVKALRVVEAHDVVTKVPGMLPAAEAYAHVGRELRVDSRASPYLRPNAGPGCCHDLEAYLHLVDGFMGTGCPFRSNAKRSIARLFDQQRASVKSLYVNKARELGVGPLDPAAAAVLRSGATGCLPSPSA